MFSKVSACPHTKQFIPKLYNDTSYKESSYKFQDVHTQETSSLKNHRINSRVSTHTKKLSRNSITKRRIGAQFATAQSKVKQKHMCSTTSIDCATGTMHAVYLCIISWLRSGQLEAEMRAHISFISRSR